MWLFYLLLFLLPANLAKHFPFSFSYVSGYKVDYLIPTLYLTDILIILLLIFNKGQTFVKLLKSPLFIFLLCLLPSVIFSASFWPAAYKFIKIIEFSLLAVWIYQYKSKLSRTKIIQIMSLSALFQSLLALAQWFKQGSIFGYWFLGEQPYTSATFGIDKITWFDGSLKIPPLGTFPHPNVLAGFLVIVFTATAAYWFKKSKLFFILYSLFCILALFFTFSLSAWLAFLLIGLPLSLQGPFLKVLPRRKFLMLYTGSLLIILSLALDFSFLAPETSFSRRSQLTQMSLQMFKTHPLTGVGLNNFTVVMDQYGLIPASTRWLQPVHNVFLLILSETGLFGLAGFIYLFFKSLKSFPSILNTKFFILIFLGLFDHYLLTLQPGLLLLCLTYIL